MALSPYVHVLDSLDAPQMYFVSMHLCTYKQIYLTATFPSSFSIFAVSTSMVEAVLGKTTTLPCDIEPEVPSDRVYMVLWFRENAGKPLYR